MRNALLGTNCTCYSVHLQWTFLMCHLWMDPVMAFLYIANGSFMWLWLSLTENRVVTFPGSASSRRSFPLRTSCAPSLSGSLSGPCTMASCKGSTETGNGSHQWAHISPKKPPTESLTAFMPGPDINHQELPAVVGLFLYCQLGHFRNYNQCYTYNIHHRGVLSK